MMSVPLLHESWRLAVEKFVAIGTVCAYPRYTPVPFGEEKLWDGYPEETNAPYGLAKKMLHTLVRRAGVLRHSGPGGSMEDGGDTSVDVEVWHCQEISVQSDEVVNTIVTHRGQVVGISGQEVEGPHMGQGIESEKGFCSHQSDPRVSIDFFDKLL